ncbi:MAG: hypothetical protein LRY73_08185 [Bacillus sp. (in: Bacteria)]|nr:hypothetical protein [Bacillus sp. (in: firmicutes)]
METKGWIIGNILIGAGAVISFLYVLFGLFWTNPNLVPWFLVCVFVVFLLFNYFAIKEQRVHNWILALTIMLGSAGITYFVHMLFVI